MSRLPKNEIMSLVGGSPGFDLGESYGPNLLLSAILGDAADLTKLELGYGGVRGDARLRGAIASLYDVGPDDVVVTVGGMQALFLVAFILCGSGDEAITSSPNFPPSRSVLSAVGAKVRLLPLSFDEHYRVDPRRVAALLSPRTKLVSLCSPLNPSGTAIPRDVLEEILAMMAQQCPDAYLLVDDSYRRASYGNDLVGFNPIELGSKVICVASLSKCHGVPGLRIGWAVSRDAALREQFVLGKFNTAISTSVVDEALALKLFEQQDRILSDRRALMATALQMLSRWLDEHQALVEWVRPDAGGLCCIRLKHAMFDDHDVARFFAALTQENVQVAKGSWFGDEARIFRLGFAHLPLQAFDKALAVMGTTLQRVARAAA